jgi:hypothetical protein
MAVVKLDQMASGVVALDGSGATTVSTGLKSITAVVLTLKGSSAPGLSTSCLSWTASGGTLSIYPWEVTGAGDTTLVASNGTEDVAWIAYGEA